MVPTSRRTFVRLVALTGASAALAGCDAGTDALQQMFAEEQAFVPPSSDEIDLVAHVLNRMTWGARAGDAERVRAMGVDAYIDEQLAPEAIGDRWCDRRVASIESVYEPTGELYEYDARELLRDLTRYKILRGVYSRRQLSEVMVDFWTDHFNIVSAKGQCRWLKTADDRDVIRTHALGRFRSLVRASALSPAMLIYLDGHDNKVERDGDRPNENYARELLELHTLGVDGGYTQADVSEVARCLSGWTYRNEPFRLAAARVAFDSGRHDNGTKRVLGTVIPAEGGPDDLERVLDLACLHPATGRHLATKLCRRFIADPAPASAVEEVARAFRASEGDIRTTLRALFATDEFRKDRAFRGSLFKRPLRFVVSALRGTAAQTNAGPPVIEVLERMGHAPFQYPSPDGYPMEATPWLGTLLWRWNFALALEGGSIAGTGINREKLLRELGGRENVAAHLLGRRPAGLEAELLVNSAHPLALTLASPAFQWH